MIKLVILQNKKVAILLALFSTVLNAGLRAFFASLLKCSRVISLAGGQID